ncbi:MAG: hypothetical protein R2749_09005 [Acidimicrobiales bacterium]
MSPRPGRITATIDIDLPYPRTASVRDQPRFYELVGEVRSAQRRPGPSVTAANPPPNPASGAAPGWVAPPRPGAGAGAHRACSCCSSAPGRRG